MKRTLLLFLIWPLVSARAETPYLSLGIQQSAVRFEYEAAGLFRGDDNHNFASLGPALDIGLSGEVLEWHLRGCWAKSNIREDKSEVTTVYDDGMGWSRLHSDEKEQWSDVRIQFGPRWFPTTNLKRTRCLYAGMDITFSSFKWKQWQTNQHEVVWLDPFGEETHHSFSTTKSDTTRYSQYSFGLALDVGVRTHCYESLFMDLGGQLNLSKAVFREGGGTDNEFRVNARVFEPCVILSLRWEFPRVDIRMQHPSTVQECSRRS